MSAWMLYAASAVAMAVVGLVGAFAREHPVRTILALNVASSGVFLILVASARRAATNVPDPVPHALILTGIVVSVSATALALSLAKRLARERDGPER